MPDSPEPRTDDMSREALQAEVERLRWLLDANPQVPWSADAEGNITDFSQRWLDLTGLTHEQALGGGWVAAPHAEDVPAMVEAWTRSLATGEPYDVRHRIRVADGTYRWMHTWATPRRGASGEVLAWFGSTEDVHDATIQTERLYATADALPAMVFHVDADLRYRFANRNVEATFGRPRSEILGRTIREMVGEATYAAVLPYLQKALAGERTEWAMWVGFPTGRRFARTTYVPSLGAGGEVVGIDVLAVDETEARLTEEALRASEARQRVLAELGEATAEMEGAEEIMLTVAQTLGRHLGVSRCSYALVEDDEDTFVIPGGLNDGVEPIVGAFRLSSFGQEMAARTRLGHPSVVRDVRLEIDSPKTLAAYESIQTRSYVLMPLLRGGRLVALMSVDHREPRDWAPEEVELVRTVTDRSWGYVERARAERALRRSAETFESLVRNSPFGVYVVDADFRLALVSQGAQKVFQSVRPLIGRDFAEVLRRIWEEPFASEAIGVFRRVLETGEPFHSPRTVESRFDVEDVESYDWRVERIAMPDGRFAAVCHFYDLSERLAYEASLNERDERFAAAIGAIGVLWTNSPDGRMHGEQPGWAALTGQSQEEYEGHGWADAVHPEDAQPTIDAWNEAVRERRTFEFEHRVRRSDGEWRRFSIRAVPVLDARGKAREWVGVHADVTELRGAIDALRRSEAELERKVRERTADLQASNEALNGFMYHVAHDLRTPLRSIASTSRIVMEDFGEALPEEAVGQLVRQAKAATRLGALIDDLLRLSKLSQQTVERAPIDLTRMVREVAAESLAAHPGTSVRVDVQEGLDAWADPRLLRLALGNLVENAVKYSPAGGTVLVGRHRNGAYFVSDEGIGIDPRYFGKVFEPFQRLHSDEEFAGTGIGLSNVRQVMERHGGKIWVESKPERGSTFSFTLGETVR